MWKLSKFCWSIKMNKFHQMRSFSNWCMYLRRFFFVTKFFWETFAKYLAGKNRKGTFFNEHFQEISSWNAHMRHYSDFADILIWVEIEVIRKLSKTKYHLIQVFPVKIANSYICWFDEFCKKQHMSPKSKKIDDLMIVTWVKFEI